MGVPAWLPEEVGFLEAAVPSCRLVERVICAWSVFTHSGILLVVGWEQGWSPEWLSLLESTAAGHQEPVHSLDLEVLRTFQNQIAAIQRDAVWWLHTVVPSVSKLAPKDYVHW